MEALAFCAVFFGFPLFLGAMIYPTKKREARNKLEGILIDAFYEMFDAFEGEFKRDPA